MAAHAPTGAPAIGTVGSSGAALALAGVLLASTIGALDAPASAFTANGLVVFMSDFGTKDDAVAVCKGVMLSRAIELRIVDLTHEVTPFAVEEGALYLEGAAEAFPAGTVFVAVVDPGVGTSRRAVVVEVGNEQVFVAPDNGLVSGVIADRPDVRAWIIQDPAFTLAGRSTTFHGRDVFAPAAAVLAAGRAAPADAGPELPVSDLVRIAFPEPRVTGSGIAGEVMVLDKAYGNVWTNIPRTLVEPGGDRPSMLAVRLGERAFELPLAATFGDVEEGAALAYFNSRGRLSFAINRGNFAAHFGVVPGVPVLVTIPTVGRSPEAGSRR